MKSTFENCENLESFVFSGFDTSKVKSMKNLFYGTKLQSINLVELHTENVEDFSYMFSSVETDNIVMDKLS